MNKCFFIRVIQDEFSKNLIFKLNSEIEGENYYSKLNDLMADMLSSFCVKNNVFFCFTEYDKNLDPNREDMRSEVFESFYNREPLYDRSGYLSNPVKEILYNYYHKANCESNIKDIEDIKESLLTRFRQMPIENMDEHLKDSIADILYDKSYLCRLTDYSKESQEFVNQKLILLSNQWEFSYSEGLDFEKNPSYIRDLWIKLHGKEDMIKWFENFCSDFACIVTKDNNIYDYSYYLVHKFEEWNTGEEIVIEVLEKEKGSFLKDILPILKEKFNDRIEKFNKLE